VTSKTPAIPAIVLAAGKSTRMGRPKPLLPLDGLPLIAHSLNTLSAGGAGPMVLVTADLHDALVPIAAAHQAHLVRNPQADGDMASSVLSGLRALTTLAANADGVLIQPGDYPRVLPATVATLIRLHASHRDDILIPICQHLRGHPTLFPRVLLAELGHGKTLRDIIGAHPDAVRLVPVDDPGVLQDVDSPEDYAALGGRLI